MAQSKKCNCTRRNSANLKEETRRGSRNTSNCSSSSTRNCSK